MNGVHDMGGMHNMGPIPYEDNEPIFHEQWEARMFALTRPMGAWRKWNLHATRHQREQIPPAEYLRMSYYEIWLTALIEQMVKAAFVSYAEIESGTPAPDSPKLTPALTKDKVLSLIARGAPDSRDVPAIARFQTGQTVRARNINPVGHTRPWQAQAFALAVQLSGQGYFTWKEWAGALAGELRAVSERGEPDDGTRYYHHWLAALECLVIAKGLTSRNALLRRKEAWAEAYQHTRHGKPVELSASLGCAAEPDRNLV